MIEKISPLLCPPGNGVFAVNTGKKEREKIHDLLYGTIHENEVEKNWKDELLKLPTRPDLPVLLGVCSDCGGGEQKGANWGPLFLRQDFYELAQKKIKEQIIDIGDIKIIPHLLHDKYLNEETLKSCRLGLYKDERSLLPVSPLSMTEYVLQQIYNENPARKVLILGGDHSISYPAIKTFLEAKKRAKITPAIIHFDAQTDLLAERTGLDICFHSWCSSLLADLPSPDHLIQVGIRSSQNPKKYWEKNFGVKQYWAEDFFSEGTSVIAKKVINELKIKKVDEIYITFDINALDITEASATGVPTPGGLKTHDCLTLLRAIEKSFPITGCNLMEVAPFVNIPKDTAQVTPEPQGTLMSAEALINFFLDSISEN